MSSLLHSIKQASKQGGDLPFAVYSSVHQQHLLNVPIVKPLLIVVLSGTKELGKATDVTCSAGDFVFLAASPAIDMRNIPNDTEYFALLIEFDHDDLRGLHNSAIATPHHYVGQTTTLLLNCLQQFVESACWAPKSLWSLRKREIIELLCHDGHEQILARLGNAKVSQRLHDMFCEQHFAEITLTTICSTLAMSESTLRRKLNAEGTSVQEVKDQARLGMGLHLLQTSTDSIGVIAERCGYLSQSRFTERFKSRFGLTPSELRKTKMTD